MPDPITLAGTGLAFLGMAVSGVIGNRADQWVMQSCGAMGGILKREANNLPLNHDLLTAGRTAFRQSVEWLASGVLAQEYPDLSLLQVWQDRWKNGSFWDQPLLVNLKSPEQLWLKRLVILAGDSAVVAKFDDLLLGSMEAYTNALKPDRDAAAQLLHDALLAWCRSTVNVGTMPAVFADAVHKGWSTGSAADGPVTFYEAFCLFLAEQIKHSHAVFAIFVARQQIELQGTLQQLLQRPPSGVSSEQWQQFLNGMAASTQEQQLALAELSQQAGQLAGKLTELQHQLDGRFEAVDASLAGLLGIAVSTKADIAALPVLIHKRFDSVESQLDRIEQKVTTGSSASTAMGEITIESRPSVCLGRDRQIQQLIAAMTTSPHSRPVGILGEPGIGKSTVALMALWSNPVTERFGDRRIFLRCDSLRDASSLLDAIGRYLGLVSTTGDMENQIAYSLRQRPAAIVLDNFETPWTGSDSANVEALLSRLAAHTTSAIVVTARGPDLPGKFSGALPIRLEALTVEDSCRVFVAHANGKHADDPNLVTLGSELHGVPLALYLVARKSASYDTLQPIYREWQQRRTKLLVEGAHKNDPAKCVEAAYEVSLSGQVDENAEAKQILAVLSILPDGIRQQHLETICNRGEKLFDAIGLLSGPGRGLIFRKGNRLLMLPLLRQYGLERFKQHRALRDRTYEFFLTLARDLGKQAGSQSAQAAINELVPELGNVTSLLHDVFQRVRGQA